MQNIRGLGVYNMDAATRDVALGVAQGRRRDPRLEAAADRLYLDNSRIYVEALHRVSQGRSPVSFCELLTEGLLGAVLFRTVLSNKQIAEAEIAELVDQAIRSAKAGPGPGWRA